MRRAGMDAALQAQAVPHVDVPPVRPLRPLPYDRPARAAIAADSAEASDTNLIVHVPRRWPPTAGFWVRDIDGGPLRFVDAHPDAGSTLYSRYPEGISADYATHIERSIDRVLNAAANKQDALDRILRKPYVGSLRDRFAPVPSRFYDRLLNGGVSGGDFSAYFGADQTSGVRSRAGLVINTTTPLVPASGGAALDIGTPIGSITIQMAWSNLVSSLGANPGPIDTSVLDSAPGYVAGVSITRSTGQVQLGLRNSASVNGSSSTGDLDLSDDFESDGTITFTTGALSVSVQINNADTSAGYSWVPANATEVIAYADAVAGLPALQRDTTIRFGADASPVGSASIPGFGGALDGVRAPGGPGRGGSATVGTLSRRGGDGGHGTAGASGTDANIPGGLAVSQYAALEALATGVWSRDTLSIGGGGGLGRAGLNTRFGGFGGPAFVRTSQNDVSESTSRDLRGSAGEGTSATAKGGDGSGGFYGAVTLRGFTLASNTDIDLRNGGDDATSGNGRLTVWCVDSASFNGTRTGAVTTVFQIYPAVPRGGILVSSP